MNELFNITNCYQDDNYYYFFRALNKRDMAGIRDKSILDDAGHISKIITDSKFYNHTDRYNEESSLTLEEMINHVKTHYDKDTNCISLSSDANVCLTYGRSDYEDKYVIVKVPKNELGKTTFNAGKYIYEEILKRVNAYIEEHQADLTDLQRYYIESLKNISTKEQLDSLKRTLPEKYTDKTSEEFQNGLEFIKSKPYEGYNDAENLAKDKLVMLLDVLNFEVVKGKTNRFVIQTMGSAFSSRELEYYKDVPQEKIIELPTSLVEIMALLQQVPETEEVGEIKSYLISHLDEIRQNTKEINYNYFKPEDLNLSLDNLYNLTGGKISYKEAKELYLNSMYLVKARLRSFYSVNILNQILGNNPKYNATLQSILDNSLGIEPAIMTRSGNHAMKVSDTVALYLPKNYKSVYDYVNDLQVQDMYNLFSSPTATFNTLFSEYINGKELQFQDKEEWYANGLIDSIDLESLNVKTNFNQNQRRKIVNALVSHNFMNYYEKVKTLSDDASIATSMFASLIANRKEFTNDTNIILDQLKDYIGYNNLKKYNLPLRKLQRRAYEKTEELFARKNFATAVMPTGSGKSFLALAEMLERKNDKMLYIAPNDIILNQIEDYIYEFFGYKDYHTLFPNLTLTTYQDLKNQKQNRLKEKYNSKYDFIILDELHRSGAPEWSRFINELMANQDKEKIKVLGLTATPERDRDDKDMSVYWARYFGYTDEEIELNKHLAINESLETAIKAGLLANPKFINCLYLYKSDGTLDEMYERISMLDDGEKKAKAFSKYEQLCRSVEQSSGIEKILGNNLSKDGKYVVFLPVSRSKDGTYYNSEDGSKISRTQAVQIMEDYTILIRQYLYSNEYMKTNGEKLLFIYNKIVEKQELSSEDKAFLDKEQDNIMLLDMVKIKHKPAALNTFNSTVVSIIARHQGWKKLDRSTLKERIEFKTKDMIATNSLLSYYSNSKNKEELDNFNEDTNGKPKLLFVMDKLNEGAHLKGVKGIVWLRPLGVNSRILFYQQLGRCIHSYPDGHVFNEEERPIVMDLVNNINTVNLKREQSSIDDLEDLKTILDWINDNAGKFPDKNSNILEEKNYALKLNAILYRYIKYFNNQEELDSTKNKKVIAEILRLGSKIDLWNVKIDEPTRQRKAKESEDEEEKFLQGFLQVESSVSYFVNLEHEINELVSPEEVFNKWYKLACEYYSEHGDLLVPQRYQTSAKENLGAWISNVRKAYKKGDLSSDQIEKLESIDMVWDVKEYEWNKWYELAKEYRNKDDDLLVPKDYQTKSGENLGTWISNARKAYKKGDLSSDQIERLESIDMVWDVKEYEWNKWYELATEYRNKHDDLLVPQNYKMKSGENLGTWISRARIDYKNGDLSQDKIEKLEVIDMVWDVSINKEEVWNKWYELAKEYRNEHDDLLVPYKYKTPSGENLGWWINTTRIAYKKGNLSPDQIGRLNAIGMVWSAQENKWNKMYKLAVEYRNEYGDLLVPFDYKTKSGENLGQWISECRKDYKKGNLSPDKIEKLNAIGMVWDASINKKEAWTKWYELAKEYRNEHGDLLVPYKYKTKSGENLGQWMVTERQAYKNGNLLPDEIEKLESIGMVWDVNEYKWNRMYKLAEEYYYEHGDLLVAGSYKTSSGENLGIWISAARQDYKDGNLSPDKIKKLEAVGMVWDASIDYEEKWNNWYNLAVEYYNEHGDLLMSKKYKTSSGENLGLWISTIRAAYKNGSLSPDKIKKLESIGMVWDASINKEENWNKWYELAKEYRDEYGDLLAPALYKTSSGKNLGQWISDTRKAYKKGSLSPDKIKKLEAIGMVWDASINKEENWNKWYNLAVEYYNKHGNMLVSKKYETSSGENLCKWIANKRTAYKKGNLLPSQVEMLESIGMVWDAKVNKKDIETYLEELKTSEPPIIIDKKINKDILQRISLLELQSKIKFLISKEISPVDNSGKLIDIFSMSNPDIEEKYGVSLETIINTYGKGVARK